MPDNWYPIIEIYEYIIHGIAVLVFTIFFYVVVTLHHKNTLSPINLTDDFSAFLTANILHEHSPLIKEALFRFFFLVLFLLIRLSDRIYNVADNWHTHGWAFFFRHPTEVETCVDG
jgi:hypothetical protein